MVQQTLQPFGYGNNDPVASADPAGESAPVTEPDTGPGALGHEILCGGHWPRCHYKHLDDLGEGTMYCGSPSSWECKGPMATDINMKALYDGRAAELTRSSCYTEATDYEWGGSRNLQVHAGALGAWVFDWSGLCRSHLSDKTSITDCPPPAKPTPGNPFPDHCNDYLKEWGHISYTIDVAVDVCAAADPGEECEIHDYYAGDLAWAAVGIRGRFSTGGSYDLSYVGSCSGALCPEAGEGNSEPDPPEEEAARK